MSLPDPQKVSTLLKECAAEYILPRYKALAEHEISSKTSPRDLVTQADIDVEHHLERVLPDLWPGSFVIGEEGISTGLHSLDLLSNSEGRLWIVDPVDGTFNFVKGGRHFGMMVACVDHGELVMSWIYDVPGDQMTTAEKGSGAFREKERISVRDIAEPARITGHINPRFFPASARAGLAAVGEKFEACKTLGCAAHEYLRIATGQAQFSIYNKIKPWDHLPGNLIVCEAGGQVVLWDKSLYRPFHTGVGLIVTAGPDTLTAIYDDYLGEFNTFKKVSGA